MKSPLLLAVAVGSAAMAVYFWVEASELQSTITLAQEARDVAEYNNLELHKRIQELKTNKPPVSKNARLTKTNASDRATRQLCATMRRLTSREKEACRHVSQLVNELEMIRHEIHETYRQRNSYKKKMSVLMCQRDIVRYT